MLQQIRNPLGIPNVGLASRHGSHVLRIDHQQFQAPFQNVVHRLPIHARALHCHVRASRLHQPFLHRLQLTCCRSELTDLLLATLPQ